MANAYTYRDPTLSLWQSAVAEVQRKRAAKPAVAAATLAASTAPADTPPDFMSAAHLVGAPLSDGQTPVLTTPAASKPLTTTAALGPVISDIGDCASVAAQFLWAEIRGDSDAAKKCEDEIKFSVCDALGWSECIATYALLKASAGSIPYRPNQDVTFPLPANATIAILGDWGTGDDVASNLLRQVATFKPDILLHLGDIYYSGTQSEASNNFLALCRNVLGNGPTLFSLCGNHDVYSGGNGYYWLLDQIGQKSSYFALQNDDWLFLAMDTGYNDQNPFTVNTNMTALPNVNGWDEAAWHLNKINNAGSRRIALFSHHQLFSPFGSVGSDSGKPYAYNLNLYKAFQAVLSKIDVWFWGHEHTLALYDDYMGLVRGRCIGASAVPVFTNEQSYTPDNGLQTLSGSLPTWNPAATLGNNGTDYNNAFAILTLNGKVATVNYYQVPPGQPFAQLPFTDTI